MTRLDNQELRGVRYRRPHPVPKPDLVIEPVPEAVHLGRVQQLQGELDPSLGRVVDHALSGGLPPWLRVECRVREGQRLHHLPGRVLLAQGKLGARLGLSGRAHVRPSRLDEHVTRHLRGAVRRRRRSIRELLEGGGGERREIERIPVAILIVRAVRRHVQPQGMGDREQRVPGRRQAVQRVVDHLGPIGHHVDRVADDLIQKHRIRVAELQRTR